MSFRSVNEADRFGYDDCQLMEYKKTENGVRFILESLSVKENNSQNSNYTESYAATTVMEINQARPICIIKIGYKKYDADNNLVEQIADEELELATLDSLLKSLEGSYLYRLKVEEHKNDNETDEGAIKYMYRLEIEEAECVDAVAEAYEIDFAGGDIIFTWDAYMNRVQK